MTTVRTTAGGEPIDELALRFETALLVNIRPEEVPAIAEAVEALDGSTTAATLQGLLDRWACCEREVLGSPHDGCTWCGGEE